MFFQPFLLSDDTHPTAVALRLRLTYHAFKLCGNTLAAGNAVLSREMKASPYGMLSMGNGDPNGIAFEAFCRMLHRPMHPITGEPTHNCSMEVGPKQDPVCPACAYNAYVTRIAHVSIGSRLEREEELAFQAISAVISNEFGNWYRNSAIRKRDRYTAADIT